MKEQKDVNYNFDSTDIIRFMFRFKWPIIIITTVAAIASIIVSLSITPKFKSSVILFPKTQVSISQALNDAELITPENHIMNFGEEEETEQLLQALHAEEIRNTIIERFDLFNHYQIEPGSEYPMTKLHEEYNDNISFSRTDYMAIRIEVLDRDPQMAADIANEIAALLDSTLNRMQQEVALELYDIVKGEYKSLQNDIKLLEDSVQQMQNAGVRPNNPRYVSLMEYMLKETERLSVMKSKYTEARVNAFNSLPRKFTVTRAYPAERKAYPIRWLIVVVSTLAAFVFAVLVSLFFDRYKDLLGFDKK